MDDGVASIGPRHRCSIATLQSSTIHGVSELTVRVRKMENTTAHPVEFLNKMAEALSIKSKQSHTLFIFTTEPTRLLNGDQGVWSRLQIKRFWIPIYQRVLYGIKNKRYLCTVSVSGLEKHSTISGVLCLGIFETVRINSIKKT